MAEDFMTNLLSQVSPEVVTSALGHVKDMISKGVNAELTKVVDKPQDAGYQAYRDAASAFHSIGEGTRADAAKHMTWNAELAKSTGLPLGLAALVSNVVGVGKEAMDAVGSTANYVKGTGDNPIPTIVNSLMDLRNNYVGASQLQEAPDIGKAAIALAAKATSNPVEAILKGLPYAYKE